MLPTPSDEQKALYRLAFARNCFALLVRAYRALDTHSLQAAQETHITGELVRVAQELVQDTEAESWMQDIWPSEEIAQNVSGRYGKSRPRIDMEFVLTARGVRPKFLIEAKRLYRSDSVNDYFGQEGLGMFVSGEYGGQWPSAGMLGYVQSSNGNAWLAKMAVGLIARHAELRCSTSAGLTAAGWDVEGLQSVQISCHHRTTQCVGTIDIFHLLLEFL